MARIREFYIKGGKTPSTASDHARQVVDFYTSGADTLWITFVGGDLWWCFAEPEVVYVEPERRGQMGSRYRKAINGWKNATVGGKSLHMAALNGNLTKVAMYRGAICAIHPAQFDYLMRKLNDDELPQVAEAQKARESAIGSIVALMQLLQPADFEILVDLVFSQSGWRRLGAVGKTQKTVDMELELPSTGERAFIQVKSHTKQDELDHYIEQFEQRGDDRMFFVYHTARYGIVVDHPRVMLVDPTRLAGMVLQAGLFDWLLQKAG
jgi:hypothetical protein